MLRKIKVYGQLAKFIGSRVLEADVATAAEAVRMLAANFPGLEKHMADQHYRVTVGSYDLTLDEIHDPAGQQDIMIVPVIAGAGAAGVPRNKYFLKSSASSTSMSLYIKPKTAKDISNTNKTMPHRGLLALRLKTSASAACADAAEAAPKTGAPNTGSRGVRSSNAEMEAASCGL